MIFLIPLLVVLGFQEPALNNVFGGKPEYVYVGCHVVTDNPSKENDVAFGPFGVKTTHVFSNRFQKMEQLLR